MTLTLRLRQEDGHPAGQTSERLLEHGRLVLGRGAESDWVLTDPGRTISKRHCVIEEAELGYELIDLSTNGVFINDACEPVGIGNTYRLQHGDQIRIGPYSLSVALSGGESPSGYPPAPALVSSFDSVTELFREQPGVPGTIASFDEAPPFKPPGLTDIDQGSPIDEFFASQPRAATTAGRTAIASLPADSAPSIFETREEWAKAAAAMAAERPPAAPAASAPTATSSLPEREAAPAADVMGAFCAGAGLNPSDLAGACPEEAMRKAGELLRIAVDGLMAVLASRRTLKNEFRLLATEFRAAENNPLKFSVDAETAMRTLIGKPQRGYLPAKEAFGEAVEDLRTHEVAVLAGMQEAWLSLLHRFQPRNLSNRLEDDSGLANLLTSKKARCWDAFVTLYDSIAGNADNEWERTFRSIFGAAYERSMQQQRQRAP